MAASSSKRDSVTRPQPQDERNYQSDPEVRKVVLINNGDKLSRGRPFVFNVNKVTHWDSLLQDFSDHVRPAYGIVRKVYTPNQGTEVTNVQDISQNGVYIVSGTEKFKPIPNGYNADTIIDQPFTHAPRGSIGIQLKPEKELPVHYSGIDVPDLRKVSTLLVTIFVFRNGDDVNPPMKCMLKRFDLFNILRAKDAIAEKVKPTGGYCKSLRSLDGKAVKHVADLKHNGYYVAVGPHETFRHVDYSPDGRPNIIVPMKNRSSFTAQTYQDPEGQKRRRTFVVRLKKTDEAAGGETDQADEDEEEDAEPAQGGSRNGSGSRHGSRHSQTRGGRMSQDRDATAAGASDEEDDDDEEGDRASWNTTRKSVHDQDPSLLGPVETKMSACSLALALPESRLGMMNMERSDHELVTVKSSHLSHHSHHSHHSEKAASHHDLEEHGEAPAPGEPGHDSQPNGAVPSEYSEYPDDPGHHEGEEHPPGGEVPAEEHHDEQPSESVNGDQAEKPPGEVLSAVHEDVEGGHPGDPPVPEGDLVEGDQVENPEQTVTVDDAPHEVGIAGDHPTEPDVLSGSEPEKEPSKSEKFDLTEEEEVVPTPKKKKGGCC